GIRAESNVPVVMLTAKSDTVDVVLGLESGADDYVVKPFKPKELVARVRARMRRTEDEPAETLEIGDLAIDVSGHEVTRNGEAISLTPLEFDLLVALARKPRQVFSRETLLEHVWGYQYAADTRRSEEHTSELQSRFALVCRLLLEKKKRKAIMHYFSGYQEPVKQHYLRILTVTKLETMNMDGDRYPSSIAKEDATRSVLSYQQKMN